MKMQSSEEWYKTQVDVHGMVKKPYHYRLAQRKAIDLFFQDTPKSASILDVGCGEGTGIKHLVSLGYKDIIGIEVNPCKAQLAHRRWWGKVVLGDFEYYSPERKFDVLWMSHCFEHMRNPFNAVDKILELVSSTGFVFMILPYPDTGDKLAHCASEAIGLREHDKGHTVTEWFKLNGFNVDYGFSTFREPEIWLEMTPK